MLLTTATAVNGNRAGVFVGSLFAPTQAGGVNGTVTLAIGTYYIWVQRAGQAPAFVSATTVPNVANSIMETTAVAGQGNVPASATATTKQIAPVAFSAASTTFTANTVNASNTLTNLVGANTGSGPFIGATLNGTGVAGLTVIGVTYSPSGTVTSIIMSGNASATNAAVTMTVTGVLECSLLWPTIVKTN